MNINVEYKITTTIDGKCPLCNGKLHMENIEELSDNMPSQDYFEKRAREIMENPENFEVFLRENPTYQNLQNLHDAWNKRMEELQIRSLIKSETIYVFNGGCPYCNKEINLRKVMLVLHNAPPRLIDEFQEEKTLVDWLTILKQLSKGDLARLQDPSRNSHFIENCPECNEKIHLVDGQFFKAIDCPAHGIDLTGATMGIEK